jgi:hypothetical protein
MYLVINKLLKMKLTDSICHYKLKKHIENEYNKQKEESNEQNMHQINIKDNLITLVIVFFKKILDFIILKHSKINSKFILKLIIKIIYLASKFYLK